MSDEYVSIIRKSSRDLLNYNRKIQRDVENDMHRPVRDLRITEENILAIANKLKTKTKVSASELQMIKNGIMDDQKYIAIILNVHGALRGIIREFTGRNAKNQLEAAGCCCNLALGDERASLVVAKAAGTYLTTELNSLNYELAVTCAWTLGNLAGSGHKVCNVLISQGALGKLIELLANENLCGAALYALEHVAYQLKDELRSEYLSKILISLTQIEVKEESSRLLFILSCHTDFPTLLTEELCQKLLLKLSTSIDEYLNGNDKENYQLIYIIRTLANSDKWDAILNYFVINNLSVAIKHVFCTNNVILNNSLLWLLGNLFKYDGNNDFFKLLI